jgi:L-fucose isomerase-like protein
METLDLSHVFHRMTQVKEDGAYQAKKQALLGCGSWTQVPTAAQDKLVRLGLVLDQIIAEFKLDALAVRCWLEMQQQLGVSPCVLLGEMNDRGIAAACEVDVGNAVVMHALGAMSGKGVACLDWNNNYGEEEDKCILFHCGPVPPSLMKGKGDISDHAILANATGEGCGYGCNVGRIAPVAFTFGSMMTFEGKPRFYAGKGCFTEDPIPQDFFGCAGVAQIEHLQDVLLHVGYHGHRHHTSVTPGDFVAPLHEALTRYLGMDCTLPQECCSC